jgi:secreted trypsin-like serine protease
MKLFLCLIIFAVSKTIQCSTSKNNFRAIARDLDLRSIAEGQDILSKSEVRRGGRIVYGEQVSSITQFPFYAYLVIYVPDGQIFCGGALVSSTIVVTAAHCIEKASSVQAFFGSVDKKSFTVQRNAASVLYLSTYNQPTPINNDISIIKLQSGVTMTSTVKAIRLPARSETTKSFSQKTLTALGYGETASGYPRYMQTTKLIGVTDAECKNHHWVFTENMLCAKGLFGQSICYG